MNRTTLSFLVVLALSQFSTAAHAATRYVRLAGSDTGSCETLATSCASVGYAYDQASTDDTIDIGPGTFTEPDGLMINESIALKGAGRAPPNHTIIQAHDQPGQATDRVITASGTIELSVSDLIVRHGVAAGVSAQHREGGGLYFLGSQSILNLNNVAFIGNQATSGGGMIVRGGLLTLNAVEFSNNIASSTNSLGYGGGLYLDSDTIATISDVAFVANSTEGSGGGLYASASIMATNIRLIGNSAGYDGGGMVASNNAMSSSFTNVRLIGNVAGRDGGGHFMRAGTLAFANAIFFDNQAADNGGGIFAGRSSAGAAASLLLTNVTLAGNQASERGGGMCVGISNTAELVNTIVWGNAAGNDGNELWTCASSGSFILNHSLYGDIGGNGDFDVENSLTVSPQFIDLTGGDLHLLGDSPAINVGYPATDLSQFPGGPTNPEDLDGNPRVLDDSIDMGAYEQLQIHDNIFSDTFEMQ